MIAIDSVRDRHEHCKYPLMPIFMQISVEKFALSPIFNV